jgi:hypothetical protein
MLACTKSLDSPEIDTLKEQPALEQDTKIELSHVAKMYQRVTKTIQLSCQQNNQCKTIGVGVSPCGGYAKHFVYSSESTNVLKLSQLVKAYNDQQKLKNEKEEVVGICRFIAPPKTMCAQQRCLTANDSIL